MKNPKKIHRCISCGAVLDAPLFTLENMPAGAFYLPDQAGLKDDRGVDLPLCRCKKCGLFQLDTEPVDYYRDAMRAGGLSETMKHLRRRDYSLLIDKYGLLGKRWIECGCGNGDFLKILQDFPVEIYGTENNEENVGRAWQSLGLDGTRIFRFFPYDKDLKIPGPPYDCFLSLNFLEHQPDPVSMLGCLGNNLKDGGIGLITVPSFGYILERGFYYEFVRDHIAYYDLKSLENLLHRCGFRVLEHDTVSIGDTLRIVVQKTGTDTLAARYPGDQDGYAAGELKKKCLGLKENYLKFSEDISNFTGKLLSEGRRLALWGASHVGFTIAATTTLKDTALYFIDSSPLKQGRFAPVSHLPIVSPEEFYLRPVDVIMITARGYTAEIEKLIHEKYQATENSAAPKVCDIFDLRER